jgi:SAM-dependent methyltransferase
VRILVAIANHGTKNQRFLDQVLRAYREMPYDVDIVVLSDTPKDLGSDVEVHVGAPTDNPWSLPFAHRPLFVDRADDYDLFIYTEDDTLIETRHVRTFLELDRLLPDDEVPGFLRYEEFPSGERSYCSVHSAYRWLPGSVAVHDGEVFASFTNEHSACYLLTRAQLQHAIASGGFLTEPHEGQYDMLVSAATDPYVRCGLRRRICLTRLDDLVLHHLPDVYLGQLGITEGEFQAQRDALLEIAAGRLSPASLLEGEWAVAGMEPDVPQYLGPSDELATLVADGAVRTVLSVGCAAGRLERESLGDDVDIVGIPLDEVIASVARRRGIETTPPALDEALEWLGDRRFDLVLVPHLLPYAAEPGSLLARLSGLLEPGGRVLVAVPNARHARARALLRRPLPAGSTGRSHETDAAVPRRWARDAGMHVVTVRGERSPRIKGWTGDRLRGLDPILGDPLWLALSRRR